MRPPVPLLPLLLCLPLCLGSCGGAEADGDGPSPRRGRVAFRVSNYRQYDMEELGAATRAQPVAKLAHLCMAVFDAATGEPVSQPERHDSADADYGDFSASLPYGDYKVLFVGHDGDRRCLPASLSAVSFEDGRVPHTFFSVAEVRVSGDSPEPVAVRLRRAVAAFRLRVEDAMPPGVAAFRFETGEGSASLNALTGMASGGGGARTEVAVPEAYQGKAGVFFTVYLFLPSEACPADYTVTALGPEGAALRSRVFRAVPMRVNVLTTYSGLFFDAASGEGEASFSLSWDKTWPREQSFSY